MLKKSNNFTNVALISIEMFSEAHLTTSGNELKNSHESMVKRMVTSEKIGLIQRSTLVVKHTNISKK